MKYCTACRSSYRSQLTFCPRDQTDLQSNIQDPLIGSVIADKYQVRSMLGRGGMGQVYEAEHIEMGKVFALKVLYGDLALDDKMMARFRREARTASLLKHINIISVTDFGVTSQGLAYLVMEMLHGRSLGKLVETEGPFSAARTIHIGRQIAAALAHAHDKGLLHRDLKPENVMIEDREEAGDFATVLDFGLAQLVEGRHADTERLTMQGMIQGTPEFMSPEQTLGLELGPPSDLYALGLLLYYMLSQDLPFEMPERRVEMLALHAYEPPIPLSRVVKPPPLPSLETLVMRLLEKDPKNRYMNGRDLNFALEDIERELQQKRSSSATDTLDESMSSETLVEFFAGEVEKRSTQQQSADIVEKTIAEGMKPLIITSLPQIDAVSPNEAQLAAKQQDSIPTRQIPAQSLPETPGRPTTKAIRQVPPPPSKAKPVALLTLAVVVGVGLSVLLFWLLKM